MNEPIRIVGLTIDELVIAIVSVFGFMQCMSYPFWMFCFLILGFGGVVGLKSWKRKQKGLAIKSYLYWHGFWQKPSSSYPEFNERGFLP